MADLCYAKMCFLEYKTSQQIEHSYKTSSIKGKVNKALINNWCQSVQYSKITKNFPFYFKLNISSGKLRNKRNFHLNKNQKKKNLHIIEKYIPIFHAFSFPFVFFLFSSCFLLSLSNIEHT